MRIIISRCVLFCEKYDIDVLKMEDTWVPRSKSKR
jgi:hypothetical protein